MTGQHSVQFVAGQKISRVCVSLSNTKSAREGKVVLLRNSLCMRAVNHPARSRCVTVHEQEAGA